MVAPTLLAVATPEQCARWLPPIATGGQLASGKLLAKVTTVGLLTCLVLAPVGVALAFLALTRPGPAPADTTPVAV